MRLMRFRWAIVLGVSLVLSGCTLFGDQKEGANRLLARVYGHNLYLSEMEGMFPPGTSSTPLR